MKCDECLGKARSLSRLPEGTNIEYRGSVQALAILDADFLPLHVLVSYLLHLAFVMYHMLIFVE
jgi:ABC-type protease/lipase transport system fused ATPase/permease subunit